MTELKAGKGVTLVEEVVQKIIAKIVAAEWRVGDKIPSEEHLSKAFSVSRNTIRGALYRLNAIGLIETRHGSGSYVSRIVASELPAALCRYTSDEIERIANMLEFRRALEPEIAYFAAQRRKANDLIDILQAVQEMKRYEHDPVLYSESDLHFHLHIAKAAENYVFYTVMLGLQEQLREHFIAMNVSIGAYFGVNDHLELYNAIEKGEAQKAKEQLYMLIDRSYHVFKP